jgi:hypothetical protein
MSGLLTRIIAGGPQRRSRLHDEKGNVTPVSDFLVDAPRSVLGNLLEKLGIQGAAVPWWPGGVIRAIEAEIRPDWQVLEFGSGRSTVWLARHAGHVTAIEDHAEWYRRITGELLSGGIANVDYRFASDPAKYANPEGFSPHSLDLVIVDGSVRSDCIRTALGLVKPGGLVYLDDSDKDMTLADGDTRLCDRLLEEAAAEGLGNLRRITGFAPRQSFAKQGTIYRAAQTA